MVQPESNPRSLNRAPGNQVFTAVIFTAVVCSGFFLLSLVGILHHEMWSDELMFWMIARDSASLSDLISTLRFEYMHPWLWGLLLYGISRFTREPVAMQVLHVGIAAIAVFLLVRFAPFPRWQKLLLCLSYFLLYEYAVISRNYGLGVLFIFLACVVFPSRKRSYVPLACILAVLANVNFYSRMTAIALAAMLLVEIWRDRDWAKQVWQRKGDVFLSSVIFGIGLVLSAIQNIPPVAGGGSLAIWNQGLQPQQILSAIANLWRAYFPMPGLTLRFWNSNIIDDGFAAALCWIPLGFSLALFHRRPVILFLYLFNLAEIVLFHCLWTGLMRHLGHIFILFIACLWLSKEFPAERAAFPLPSLFTRHQSQFVAVVLTVQVIAGVYAYGMDLANPFSEAKAVAQFIRRELVRQELVRQEQPQTRFIAAGIDVFTQSISGYLDQPIFYPERDRLGTYVSSDNKARRLTSQQFLEVVANAQGSDNALLIFNKPLENPPPSLPNWNLQELTRFDRAIVKAENYSLYQFQRVR